MPNCLFTGSEFVSVGAHDPTSSGKNGSGTWPKEVNPIRKEDTVSQCSGLWWDHELRQCVLYAPKHLAHTCPSKPVAVSPLPSTIFAPRQASARSTQHCFVHKLHGFSPRWDIYRGINVEFVEKHVHLQTWTSPTGWSLICQLRSFATSNWRILALLTTGFNGARHQSTTASVEHSSQGSPIRVNQCGDKDVSTYLATSGGLPPDAP